MWTTFSMMSFLTSSSLTLLLCCNVDPDGDAGPALERVLGGHLGLGVWPRPPEAASLILSAAPLISVAASLISTLKMFTPTVGTRAVSGSKSLSLKILVT